MARHLPKQNYHHSGWKKTPVQEVSGAIEQLVKKRALVLKSGGGGGEIFSGKWESLMYKEEKKGMGGQAGS